LPGFETQAGAVFTAEIEECNLSTNPTGSQITLVTFPNVFTPNGDGVNDELFISAHNATDYQFTVFNRKGQKYFEGSGVITSDPFSVWDGICTTCGNTLQCNDDLFPVLTLINCDQSASFSQTVRPICNTNNKTGSTKNYSDDSTYIKITKEEYISEYDLEDTDPMSNNNIYEGYQLTNYPNPFNDGTIIAAYIPGEFFNSEIVVYDVVGNVINRFQLKPGHNFIEINPDDLSYGIYFYSLMADRTKIETKKMVYIR